MSNKNVERTEDGKRILKFEGVSYWGYAIFKDSVNFRFGNMDIMVNSDQTPDDIIEVLKDKPIYYFGRTFDCEPYGELMKRELVHLTI